MLNPPIFPADDNHTDPYHDLRDPNWPQVADPKILNYLQAENTYADDYLSAELQDKIFQEIKGRIQEEDQTVPYKRDNYYYYSYIKKDQDYWTYVRQKDSLNNPVEILLDINLLALNHNYCRVAAVAVSPDHQLLSYVVDTKGDERYSLFIKDIASDQIIDSKVSDIMGDNLVWDEQSSGLFYIPAGELWRSDRVYYHKLYEQQSSDILIYKEEDETFSVSIEKSESSKFIFIGSASSNATEYRFISSDKPLQVPVLIEVRADNHKYYPTHHGDSFYIVTNDKSDNFRVVKTPITSPAQKYWQEYIAASVDNIERLVAYKDHLVMEVKSKGLGELKIITIANKETESIAFPEPVYEVSLLYTTFEDPKLRYEYSSLKNPKSIIEVHLETREGAVLKVQQIPSGFDPDQYIVERLWVIAADGTEVPISLLYKKEIEKDGDNPLYLYGYGSYGIAIPTHFRSSIISMVDRGFIYAIAHIRGGGELGKPWHDAAKLLTKKNTFTDFISCAETLINKHYTSAKKIVIHGGSAGGMLMGACLNMRPDLFYAAIAEVPFVDVLNTMLDVTLPLTPGEYKEWGNPQEKEYYEYIKSYCPYTNVKKQDYPHLFVLAGLNDPRVGYWEAAKWVALLRNIKTDNNVLLLKTEMDSGHGGLSGRFDYLKEIAKMYCFILQVFQMV